MAGNVAAKRDRLTRMIRTRGGVWIAALILLLAAAQIYAFHWGVITPDTVDQYGQALTGSYDDWHPPVTAWLWHLLLQFHAGSASILLFDILLYWLGIGCFAAMALRQHGIRWALLIVAVGAIPISFGQMGSLLKDPLLATLCLLASGLIALGYVRWLAVPLLIVATATRFNAIFATLPLLVGLAPTYALKTWPRCLLAVGAAASVLAGSNWLINVVMLQPHRSEPIFSLVNFDLGGIAAQGGGNPYPSMTAEETQLLTRQCYNPRMFNPSDTASCNAVEDRLAAYAHRHGQPAISIWLHAVSANPIAYLRHRIAHLNWNWRLFVRNVPGDAVYMMSEPNEFGLSFKPNALTLFVVTGARALAWSPFGRPATWLAVALGLLLISGSLASGRLVRMLALSSLGYGGAYAAVSVAPDLRYNLWTMLAAMIATALALADIRAGARPGRGKIVAAIALVVAVIAVEIAGLMVGAEI
jgi:hypothetical protein